MTVYRAPITPGQSWFTTVGGGLVPAAAGTLETFLANTVTPAATYTDSTGNTANGTTITFDSEGRLPGVDVWLPGGVAFKFVIKDAVGNPIATVDNVTGLNDPAFAASSFSEWLDGPGPVTYISATSFSVQGDQVSQGPLNRDRRVEITSGAGTTRATLSSSTYASGTNLTTLTFDKDLNDPTPTNPISAIRYGVLNVPQPSFPSAALVLGQPRHRAADNTNVLLYGPIGSNLVVFTVPPNVVASAGGAGNQIRTAAVGPAGALEFNKTAHGRTTGQVVQLTTSNTLPGNTAAATSYIVRVFDADNFGLYALPTGWQFEQPYLDAVGNPGGLTWGNPIQFSSAGVGNQTVTPGFIAPDGVTRVWATAVGAQAGGGGSRGNTGDGGLGGVGGNSTFSTLTGNGGTPGLTQGGKNNEGGTGGPGGTSSGGAINLAGGDGGEGDFSAGAGGSHGGPGGVTAIGKAAVPGVAATALGKGGNSTAANQGAGGGGGGGGAAIGPITVTPGTWVATTVGAGGTAGAAGTGTGSAAGAAGKDGWIAIQW